MKTESQLKAEYLEIWPDILAFYDRGKSAVASSFDGIMADKDAEVAKAKADSESAIAQERGDCAAAIELVKATAAQDRENALDNLRAVHAGELEAVNGKVESLTLEKNDLSELFNSLIAHATAERDDFRKQLADTFSQQVADVMSGAASFARIEEDFQSLVGELGTLKMLLGKAVTPIAQRQAAQRETERQAAIEAKRKELAALEGK